MACDTRPVRREQTLQERIEEVRQKIITLDGRIALGQVRVVVGPQGGVTLAGWDKEERGGITDACAYRRLMSTGSALTKLAFMQAEQLAGRTIDKMAVAHGHHSHDGGKTWHGGHKGH